MLQILWVRVGVQITRLYMASSRDGIMRISANGGTPESLVKGEVRSISAFHKFCRMENPCCTRTLPDTI